MDSKQTRAFLDDMAELFNPPSTEMFKRWSPVMDRAKVRLQIARHLAMHALDASVISVQHSLAGQRKLDARLARMEALLAAMAGKDTCPLPSPRSPRRPCLPPPQERPDHVCPQPRIRWQDQ